MVLQPNDKFSEPPIMLTLAVTTNRKHTWQEWLIFCLVVSIWILTAVFQAGDAAGLLALIVLALVWNMAGQGRYRTASPESKPPVRSSELFGALVASLQRTDEWEARRCDLIHKSSGLELWIANGWFFLAAEVGRVPLSLSLLNRWRLWPHVKRLRDQIVMQKLSAPNAKPGEGNEP